MGAFVSPCPLSRRSNFTKRMPNTSKLHPRRFRSVSSMRQSSSPTMLLGFFRNRPEYDLEALAEDHPAISVQNLRKTFLKKFKGSDKKRQSRTITAVDDLSFAVPRGKIFGLLGPNSSGKTTTLRCMSTLTDPDSGTIKYYGIDAVKNATLVRQMLGFVAQSAGVDKVLTGREHLELFGGLAHLDRHVRKRNIEALVELLRLEDFIDRQSGVYSGGVVRRLDMAIALLHQPAILILDEPTVGLDIETRMVIWDVLRIWRDEGGTIILTSHYLEEVDVLSDEVGIMDKGILIAKGSPSELKNSLGGDRVTVKLKEFASIDTAEFAMQTLRKRGLLQDGIINRVRNNSLELVVDPHRAGVGSEIVQSLKEVGFESLFSFSQSKPSLDDVYLAATGKSILDADHAAKEQRSEKEARKESMA